MGQLIDTSAQRSLRNTVGSDAFDEIVETYLAQGTALVRSIADAVEASDLEGAGRAAHSLRSPSMMLGAVALADACAQLDRGTGGRPTLRQAKAAAARIQRLYGAFAKTLGDDASTPSSAPPAAGGRRGSSPPASIG